YDYGAARTLIRAVEPDSAPSPGSALADGILTAVRALRQSDAPVRAVFLLSDGEDLGGEIPRAVQEAVAEHVSVSTLGAGTSQGGTIPVRGPGGTLTLKRDRSGQIVQTRLDAGALASLAEKTGGRYALATENGRELVGLYGRVQQQLNSRVSEEPSAPEDLSSWFVLAGLLLLMAVMLLPERRGARRPIAAAGLPLAAVLLAGACTGDAGPIFKMNEEGAKFFNEGNFPAALDRFRQAQVRRPDLPPLTFNVGGALYKTQEYDRALREIQRVLDSDDAGLRSRANFNMGNAYFQKEQYQDAFDAYKRALKDNPLDLDAKINLELTLRRLEERPQQQPPLGQQPGQDSAPPDGQGPPQPQPPGNNPPGPSGQPSDNSQRGPAQLDPSAELRRALRDAGQEVDIEDALRILDALRLKEQQLQDRFNRQPPGRNQAQRPDKDW
ncbi:MAG: tetratricopeptide repeat protein, partial [Chloroflexota bacterium]